MTDNDLDLIQLAAQLVGAYVSNNALPAGDVPRLIADVYATLKAVGAPAMETAPEPAVNPKKSVFPDYLISLEDGKHYKALKRHLTRRGMTPDEYRAKWGLADDYPMVASSYTAQRSAIAKSFGFGSKAKRTPLQPIKAKRGRPPKAVILN